MFLKNIILLSLLITTLLSCDFGPKGALNEEFEEFDRTKELPYNKLIGKYQLDKDSKKRYFINDSINFNIQLKADTTIVAYPFLNSNRDILYTKKTGNLFYINDYKTPPFPFFLDSKNDKWNNNILIYYKKKDSTLALYVYTPPLKGQEHGDYLRYIKVKDDTKK